MSAWVVAFNGARDGYQVPLALAEAGQLDALVTDWYSPLDRRWFRALPSSARAAMEPALRRRFREGLPSGSVQSLWIRAAADRLRARGSGTLDAAIGHRAGTRARRRRAGIFSYSWYAHAAFAAYGDAPGPRVLYQVHPHPAALRELFLEEMDRTPECAESLRSEAGLDIPPRKFAELCGEAPAADLCVVSSRYTASTLERAGVEPGRIRVVPYGVDLERLRPGYALPGDRLRVLFVGQMVQRKGLRDLLEAWRRAGLERAELVLAGRGNADEALLARYAGLYRIERDASFDRLLELYRSSHLFCMPSLAEGFGLVYLEALACGTPVLGTPNTGAADLVTEGEEGFITPIRDVDALAARLRWCHDHLDALLAMRPKARALAERHDWSRFRDAVRQVAAEAAGATLHTTTSSAA